MAGDGTLEVEIVDVKGERIPEMVDVSLKHRELSDAFSAPNHDAMRTVTFVWLSRVPQGLHTLRVEADTHQSVAMTVNIPPGGPAFQLVRLPVRRGKVIRVNFPPYAQIKPDARRLMPEAQYNALGTLPKAGYLNLVAKANRTKFNDGRTVLSFLQQLQAVKQDRLFAAVEAALHQEAAGHPDLFHRAPDAAHTPPAGFVKVDSFKTLDTYGNLQLAFSRQNNEWRLDMDIDNAQGFEHLFQLIENTGGATHPYDIHEILIAYQELDPGYDLFVRAPAAVAARGLPLTEQL